jgi:energy-coupling factor transporter ATP-binding protein EcfA2
MGRVEIGEAELLDRMRLVGEAFRPAAPIDRRGLFSGRADEIAELYSVVAQPGQHAVVYGERGVGKTSLAAVVGELLRGSGILVARATCDSSDDYSTVWRKALSELAVNKTTQGVGFGSTATETATPASSLLGPDPVTPHAVQRALATIGQHGPVAVVFDEFDRLGEADGKARALFADTIKTLSDRVSPATIVIVGVADDVGELIREHASVERALVQIRMPRMSRDELAEIATKGVESARMTIATPSVSRITALSQGLPHYTHLLTQLAAQCALSSRRPDVTARDVDTAVARAIERAQQSVTDAYYRATAGNGDTRRRVLLACALADEDDFGFFSADDLGDPLGKIGGEGGDSLEQDLLDLARTESVLQRREQAGTDRYRFVNPLLQPYVVMRGLSEGLVKARDVR